MALPFSFLCSSGLGLDLAWVSFLGSTLLGLSLSLFLPDLSLALAELFLKLVPDWLATWWMSDTVEVSQSDLRRIVEAVEILTEAVSRLQPYVRERTFEWVEVAPREPPPLFDEEVRSRVSGELEGYGGDTGAPLVPAECLALCAHLPEGEERARRAFRLGFWACVAVDCHLAYQSEDQIPGLPSVQWVILRGGGNYNPCRVYSAEEAERILAGAEKPICEAFGSYAEVNCFCLGAGCWIPRLMSWRSRG